MVNPHTIACTRLRRMQSEVHQAAKPPAEADATSACACHQAMQQHTPFPPDALWRGPQRTSWTGVSLDPFEECEDASLSGGAAAGSVRAAELPSHMGCPAPGRSGEAGQDDDTPASSTAVGLGTPCTLLVACGCNVRERLSLVQGRQVPASELAPSSEC